MTDSCEAGLKFSAGTKVAYLDKNHGGVIIDQIWLVRKGYYHMPNDDYLHDEDIIASIVDGIKVPNLIFSRDREDRKARAEKELSTAQNWLNNVS